MDDRRYLCECIVVSTNLKEIIKNINVPSDNNHQIVYIIKSSFFKKHVLTMRESSKNKIFNCEFLVQISFDNKNKNIQFLKNINIEITCRSPHELTSNYIPDNTYIICASFGEITTRPRVQLGITEGAHISDIIYKNNYTIPEKPINLDWKFKTSNRGIKEELGIYNNNLIWTCIKEDLYNWNRKNMWVSTLLTYI